MENKGKNKVRESRGIDKKALEDKIRDRQEKKERT
jgi:hypothetical protein